MVSGNAAGFAGFIERLAAAGTLPGDSEQERLQKAILTLSAALLSGLAVIWVVTYFVLGLALSAAFPLGYQIASIANLVYFLKTKRYRLFRFTQVSLMLLLPFLMQLSMGGFIASSGVVLWSFIAPLIALLLYSPAQAVPWFTAFLGLIAIAGGLDGSFPDRTAAIPSVVRITFFVLNIAGVSTTCYLLLHYFVRERDQARTALDEEHRLLLIEQEKSERLLLNVLPKPIAERLKEAPDVIADAFKEVTVLFADIVGFTPLAERISPGEVVGLLNQVFSAFDRLAEERGLEKIKTIGDAYMVAGGLPVPRPDHAEAVAEMALAMRDEIQRLAKSTGMPLDLRIGVDSGPVVAGVIGKRKFSYDLWGDIVNTASRMESHGVPGEIQVTPRTHERLRDWFSFVERGKVPIKGKGEMTAYLLVGRKE
jgi:adenylate cyclase